MLSCCGPVARGVFEGLDDCVVVPGNLLLPSGGEFRGGLVLLRPGGNAMPNGTGKTNDQLRATGPRGYSSGSHEEAYGDKEGGRSRRERKTALAIPTELCEDLSALAASKGFRSVQEFVIHLLRDEVARAQFQLEGSGVAYSARELELIRKFFQEAEYIS